MASDLSKAFQQINKAIKNNEKSLKPVAQFVIALISTRTRKGLDADGQKFKPYSKKYYEWKYFKGKTRSQIFRKASKLARIGSKNAFNVNAFKRYSKAADVLIAYETGKDVDLTLTGHMLGSMIGKVTGPGEITVEFNGAKEIAKAVGNSRTRDFFDVRLERELDAIAEIVADELVEDMFK